MSNLEFLSHGDDLIRSVKQKGVDDVEIIFFKSTDQGIDVRNGEIENSDYSDSIGIGIRVLKGLKSSTISGSDLSKQAMEDLITRVCDSVQHLPDDPYAAISPAKDLQMQLSDLDLQCYDDYRPSLELLTKKAKQAENKALSLKGITNSEGAGCSYGEYHIEMVTSNGFYGMHKKTLFGLSCCVLAGEGTDMQRDYAYTTKTNFMDLNDPSAIGEEAALRTLQRLNPTTMRSGKAPIIFDPRTGRSLLGHFAGAISADAVVRKMSFLGDAIGKKIFSDKVNIIDNPHLKKGLASCPFDLEGVKNPPLELIKDGILQSLLTDGASSRQLNIANNGRAKRSITAAPYPASTNLYIDNGIISPKDLQSDITYGLYVTDMIGHGVNAVTGDFSIGASGFLIENGEKTSPISEITIAGNLKEMFLNMHPANDLRMDNTKNTPTLRIDGMTIAGN